MAGHFPVPRNELPQVRVSDQEHDARKTQMQRMLDALVADYERYTEGNSRTVDARRWKASASRDRLKLYKERSSYGQPHSADNDIPSGDVDAAFSEEGADSMRMSLVVGEYSGRLENAMYAVSAADQSELAMVDIFLHEDVADCAVLHTMEGPTRHDPYHFLGYKWFVRKSPMSSHLLKHRDSVYVEASGLAKTQFGEQLGYHIMHSVDLVDFPALRGRHCLRTSQSIRTLYRQRPNNIVEVFMVGNVGPSGMIKGRLATALAHETLFNMPRLVDCGEAKRLADMMRDQRAMREDRVQSKRHAGESCGLCRHPRKRFGPSIDECHVCGVDVCAKCRMQKRVFQSDGVLGRFHKIVCCKTCLLVVANAKAHGRDLVLSTGSSADASSVASPTAPRATPPSATASSSTVIRSLAEQMEIRQRSASRQAGHSPTSSLSTSSDSPRVRSLPDSPRAFADDDDVDDVDTAPLSSSQPLPPTSGPITTYRNQVIDISGSLAFVNNQNAVAASSPSLPDRPDPVSVAPPSGPVTVYRNQVIDISGSLGLQPSSARTTSTTMPAAPAAQPLDEDKPAVRSPPPVAVIGPAVAPMEPPYRASSLASSSASPPSASSPASQTELYMKMLELQRKAQDAYNTTQQNQQYLSGRSPE